MAYNYLSSVNRGTAEAVVNCGFQAMLGVAVTFNRLEANIKALDTALETIKAERLASVPEEEQKALPPFESLPLTDEHMADWEKLLSETVEVPDHTVCKVPAAKFTQGVTVVPNVLAALVSVGVIDLTEPEPKK